MFPYRNGLILPIEVYNYADDNTFVCSGYDYESVKDKVVRNVITWFESNNMMVNPDKFQCLFLAKMKI